MGIVKRYGAGCKPAPAENRIFFDIDAPLKIRFFQKIGFF
jgi:hypothetical protein